MHDQPPRFKGFLLRLPYSLRARAALLASEDGSSLNHFISMAVAEKIARMEPQEPSPPTPPLRKP